MLPEAGKCSSCNLVRDRGETLCSKAKPGVERVAHDIWDVVGGIEHWIRARLDVLVLEPRRDKGKRFSLIPPILARLPDIKICVLQTPLHSLWRHETVLAAVLPNHPLLHHVLHKAVRSRELGVDFFNVGFDELVGSILSPMQFHVQRSVPVLQQRQRVLAAHNRACLMHSLERAPQLLPFVLGCTKRFQKLLGADLALVCVSNDCQ
mmetsp:Transcript_23221/g.58199  ORF Transcript_23221/g.58199 Transcript_23221/m.58199 type:complete len:207 (+) Transcript_23221:1037-1657(+)